MNIEEFNNLTESDAKSELTKCCGSNTWGEKIIQSRPYESLELLFDKSHEVEKALSDNDWLEAFSHHPKIGETSLREKFASTADWAASEQSSVSDASDSTIDTLKRLNDEYFDKFGFIFIICATGKSADEMLGALRARIVNAKETEIKIASCQQSKITQIRLEKLFS